MDLNTHYYAVLALCRRLGIKADTAGKIAYASQYVDDALIRRIIFKKTPRGVPCHLFGKKRGLDHTATCPRIMTVWNYRPRIMIEELVPFHFIPAGRGSSFQEKIRTFPDSPLLRSLGEAAVRSGNIYLMGIFLHVLGDAYAHQGFSGMISRRNRLSGLKVRRSSIRGFNEYVINHYMIYIDSTISRLFGRVLPIYSHSHAGTLPDIASAEWSYRYDTGKSFITRYRYSGLISNPQRYRLAFEDMKRYLLEFIDHTPDIAETLHKDWDEEEFYTLMKKPVSLRESIDLWRDYLLNKQLIPQDHPALYYDPKSWLSRAFKNYNKKTFAPRIVNNAETTEDFIHSDWYRFYLASREYKEHYDRLIRKYAIY
jgi:hypothetical protein